MPESSRIHLREIAEKTGVTRMAVSLALRGKPGISQATRQKVLSAAAELGYEPDPEVAKLMSRIRAKSQAETKACMALLTSGPAAQFWKFSLTERKYVEGVHQRAREYGYRVEEFWMDEKGMTLGRLAGILWNRGIEGVVIAPLQGRLTLEKRRSVQMDFTRFSVVEISETFDWPDLDRAIHDQYTSMIKVIDELNAAGYEKVGFVVEDALNLRTNGKWSAAYLGYGLRHNAPKLAQPLILPGPNQEAFNRWFDRHQPQAIISVDRLGSTLLKGYGLSIPGPIGYATLDVDGDATDHPDMSGIDQNSNLVGGAAVDMLVAKIQRGDLGIPAHPVRTEVEGVWKQGATTRSPIER